MSGNCLIAWAVNRYCIHECMFVLKSLKNVLILTTEWSILRTIVYMHMHIQYIYVIICVSMICDIIEKRWFWVKVKQLLKTTLEPNCRKPVAMLGQLA